MKAIVHGWSTEIYPTEGEVKRLCKPGDGAGTCIWLVVGADGFECVCHNRPHSLRERLEKGETVAKRDGCDPVNNFDPVGGPGGEIEIDTSPPTKELI